MKRGLFALVVLLLLTQTAASRNRAGTFDEVWDVVKEHFFDPTLRGIDWNDIRRRYRPAVLADSDFGAAVNRMLAELRSSHTRFLTPDEPAYYELASIFRLEIEGRPAAYEGILATTRDLDGETFVEAVLEGGPAHEAGLLPGDRIVSVDGSPYHPIRSFRGRAGRRLKVRLQRTPGGPPLERSVIPRRLVPTQAWLEVLEQSARIVERNGRRLGYVRVWSYAGDEVQEKVAEVLSEQLAAAEGLILDLRGGWGGASPEYLNLFNQEVPRMEVTGRDGVVRAWESQWRKPVVLLVDGQTRSGKEILAHGFRRFGIGPVVGSRTAGAVTGGRLFRLSSGDLLYLAVLAVKVDGVDLEGVGVEPDIAVEPAPLPYRAGDDPQRERAEQVLAAALGTRTDGLPGARYGARTAPALEGNP
ncbi:MAG: PDZ domain-containing protein [Armatimonadetes bacterium]|nr:PDZ domain-containing protein [Armatimonadota bacterium]